MALHHLKPRARTEEEEQRGGRILQCQFCPSSTLSEGFRTSSLRSRLRRDTKRFGKRPQRGPIPRETIDNIIICCILVAAGRDEYKTLQSSSRPSIRGVRTCGAASPLQPIPKAR
jgi:hypothetical protein